jgi:hypothetical protein
MISPELQEQLYAENCRADELYEAGREARLLRSGSRVLPRDGMEPRFMMVCFAIMWNMNSLEMPFVFGIYVLRDSPATELRIQCM